MEMNKVDYSIEVNNIQKNYKDFKLHNVNFNLEAGTIMGLIGENGAGKTTTLKLILNLIKRDSGNIKIFGLDNITDEKQIKENIGVVFDECCFPDNITPKNITAIMSNIFTNWDNKKFISYMAEFKLPETKTIKEYSKGMKMKLSIAIALSHNPKLLILDEATSGLDPIVRDEILDIFLGFIQDSTHSILVSSHIISDLEKIADYITFMHQGEIVFSKSKDDLINNYGLIKCGVNDINKIDQNDIIKYRKNNFCYEALFENRNKIEAKYKNFVIDNVSIEDIMLFYVKGDKI